MSVNYIEGDISDNKLEYLYKMCSPDLQHCYGGIKERGCHRCRSGGASHHLGAVCRWWHHGRLAHRTTTRVVNFWSGQFWSDDSTIFTSYNVSQSSCIRDAISSWWPTRHNWCWYAVCVVPGWWRGWGGGSWDGWALGPVGGWCRGGQGLFPAKPLLLLLDAQPIWRYQASQLNTR